MSQMDQLFGLILTVSYCFLNSQLAVPWFYHPMKTEISPRLFLLCYLCLASWLASRPEKKEACLWQEFISLTGIIHVQGFYNPSLCTQRPWQRGRSVSEHRPRSAEGQVQAGEQEGSVCPGMSPAQLRARLQPQRCWGRGCRGDTCQEPFPPRREAARKPPTWAGGPPAAPREDGPASRGAERIKNQQLEATVLLLSKVHSSLHIPSKK